MAKKTATPDPEPVEGTYPAAVEEDHSNDPVKKQYRVSGTQPVFEINPGETLTAALTPEQEAYYTEGGHLEVVTGETTTEVEGDAKAPVEEEPTTESTTEE